MKYEVSTVFKGVDLMSGTIDKMQRKAKGFSHTLEGAFNNASIKLERMNSAIRGVTVSAAAWGAAYVLPLANIYKAGADVEDQLVRAFNKLDEKVPLGSARFAQLQGQIAATTKGTEVFQVSAANAFQELAGAGFDAEKSLGGLVNVYDAARFAQMDMGETAVRTVDLMKMFNLEVKDASKNTIAMRDALNMMAKADANSTTNMRQLYEAIQNGGAKAAEFGTDLATYLAMVTNFNSLKSFEAGTGAKQIFNRLIPTEATTRAMFDYLKVDVADKRTGKILDPLTILQNLTDKLATKTEYERAQSLKLIFGLEGNAPAIFMKELRNLPGKVLADRQRLYEKEDKLLEFRKEWEKTANARWLIFLKNFDDRKQKLFEPLKPKVIEAFDKAEAWMTANSDKITQVMTKMIDYLPSIASSLLTIAEYLPQILLVVGSLKGAELLSKGLRGLTGLYGMGKGMLGFPTGVPGGGAPGVPKGAGTPKTYPRGFGPTKPAPTGMPTMMQRGGIATAIVLAYAAILARATRSGASTNDAVEPLNTTTPTDATKISPPSESNRSLSKDINLKIFTSIPGLKAEVVPAGFSQSSLLLPTSGGF